MLVKCLIVLLSIALWVGQKQVSWIMRAAFCNWSRVVYLGVNYISNFLTAAHAQPTLALPHGMSSVCPNSNVPTKFHSFSIASLLGSWVADTVFV
jgi:hypothetical protein